MVENVFDWAFKAKFFRSRELTLFCGGMLKAAVFAIKYLMSSENVISSYFTVVIINSRKCYTFIFYFVLISLSFFDRMPGTNSILRSGKQSKHG